MVRQWDEAARLRGYVSLKALLIQKYVLEGRGSGWLAVWLGNSRWTVIKCLKRYNIPVRGPGLFYLSPTERDHWNIVLKREIAYRELRSRPLIPAPTRKEISLERR
jgi:hypothetical protein